QLQTTDGQLFYRWAAEAYYLAATSSIAEATTRGRKSLLEKGAAYGAKGLQLVAPDFAQALRAGNSLEMALTHLKGEHADVLAWYAINLVHLTLASGMNSVLLLQPRVELVLQRLQEI